MSTTLKLNILTAIMTKRTSDGKHMRKFYAVTDQGTIAECSTFDEDVPLRHVAQNSFITITGAQYTSNRKSYFVSAERLNVTIAKTTKVLCLFIID